MDLPGPALPPLINPGLGPSVSVVSVFWGFFVFVFVFGFFSGLKYFAKDQVIGEGRGAGAGGNAPISSEAGGVSLQQQLKRK